MGALGSAPGYLGRIAAVVLGLGGPALAADGSAIGIDWQALVDFRGALSSSTRSWEDRGLGKVRYGADAAGQRRVLGKIAEASLVLEPYFGWDLSGSVQLTATPEQRTAIDIVEAFIAYKPAPQGPWSVRGRVGVFFPPISQENTGLAWTSPYTITSSAINSWVGEELRTIGGEATLVHQTDAFRAALTGAVYLFNDPTGTLLAWRGWALHDREAGLFDRLRLPPVRIIRPTGQLSRQQPFDEPFDEIDDRFGFYVSGELTFPGIGRIAVMRYDNNANDRLFERGQWPWHTTFWSFGGSAAVTEDIDLIAQAMTGTTTLITTPVGPLVGTDFHSAFALLSRGWEQHRVSFRFDWFKTVDRDIFPDNNNERGYGLTAAYIFRPTPQQRLTLEAVYVNSRRPERAFQGLPVRARETQIQISYRFFL
jgi:hypothetical protein